jgi:hypothetical protein
MDPQIAKDSYPVATHTMTHSFFHGTSPVITPEQIDYIGAKVDEFMKRYV